MTLAIAGMATCLAVVWGSSLAYGLPPYLLPTPMGGPGFFGVYETHGVAPVADGLLPAELPILSNFVGNDDDVIQVVFHGNISIGPGDPRLWTFGTHCDDGFALRIWNAASGFQLWSTVFPPSGGVLIDGGTALSFPTPTADSDTRGTIELLPGDYILEYITYENFGGAAWELYAFPNDCPSDAACAPWALIGGPGGLALIPEPSTAALLAMGLAALARGAVIAGKVVHPTHGYADVRDWPSGLNDAAAWPAPSHRSRTRLACFASHSQTPTS